MLDQGADLISKKRFTVVRRATQFDGLLLMPHDAANVTLERTLTLRQLLRLGQRHRCSPERPEGRARISCRGSDQVVAICP